MAYTPLSEVFREWKNYRGGTVSNIWVFSFKDYSVIKIPQPKGYCNDTDPMWIGDNVITSYSIHYTKLYEYIAEKSGFGSVNSFTRVFKEAIGKTVITSYSIHYTKLYET